MARRKGDLGKSTLKKIAAGLIEDPRIAKAEFEAVTRQRSRKEIVDEVQVAFEYYEDMVTSAIKGQQRGILVCGSAGIGKTHTVERLCELAAEKEGHRFYPIKGKITPIALYAICAKYAAPGNIVYMDDADTIFNDENGCNLLKALMDTTEKRQVKWMTSRTSEDSEIPESYIFRGCIIFLSNRNLREEAKEDSTIAEHKKAIVDRAQYVDLRLHNKRDAALWAAHVVETKNILIQRGLTKQLQKEVMDWVADNAGAIEGNTSIRTAIKIAEIWHANPTKWKQHAAASLLSTGGRELMKQQEVVSAARREAIKEIAEDEGGNKQERRELREAMETLEAARREKESESGGREYKNL